MILKIQTGLDNEILRTQVSSVRNFDASLKKDVQNMEETMTQKDTKTKVKGVGLAANQVGLNKRIILVTLGVGGKRTKIVPMINPEILWLSKHTSIKEEGCLSIPEVYKKISRPSKVQARWQNIEGNWCEKKFDDWDARIFLHEFDHLEGVLFTDYL